ncbi:MAG: S-layer homology domain-containing protein [Clostridiales bacterium]|jgi:hypothetical protein|nr:S-layer homology domain-containing protein [Clostridiales bacterium]
MKKIASIILSLALCFSVVGHVYATASADASTLTVQAGGSMNGTLLTTGAADGTLAFKIVDPNGSAEVNTLTTDKGTVTITDNTTGTYSYAAKMGMTGDDVIEFKVTDNGTNPSTNSLTVTIIASNITATVGTLSVMAGETETGMLAHTGSVTGAVSYAILLSDNSTVLTHSTAKGTITITNASTGAYSYSANSSVSGDDVFDFKVSDSEGGASSAAVTVSITPAPTLSPSPSNSPQPAPTTLFDYQDIKGDWVEPYASKLAFSGTFIGTQVDGKFYFGPEIVLTRADYVIYLNAALGINPDDYKDLPNPFSDTNFPAWMENHAKAAYDKGIISGVPHGSQLFFEGHNVLNRVEAVEMLNNALYLNADVPTMKANLNFTDKTAIPDWAIDTVSNLVNAGIVNGYDDKTFRPYTSLTRSTSTKLLSVTVDYIQAHPLPSPTPSTSTSPSPSVSPSTSPSLSPSLSPSTSPTMSPTPEPSPSPTA